jgi:RHS repeat-associated protein
LSTRKDNVSGDSDINESLKVKNGSMGTNNQENYSSIIGFDSLKVRGYNEGSCQGTSKFIVYGKQHEYDASKLFNFKMFGEISDYQLISVYPKLNDTCDREPPKLCNRAYGTIEHIIPDPCKTWKKMRAATWAKVKYEAYKDSLQDNFRQKYYNTCMGARDSMDMDYELKEYHYTLYYYDQAGNLTQTVPPAGVVFVDKSRFSAIAKAKKTGSSGFNPTHTLITRYKYNTLNEVRWQKTPDGEESNFWYDRLGRMAVSQNAEQESQGIKQYSYTEYDELGRIEEVGQIVANITMDKDRAFNQVNLEYWLSNNIKDEITRTWYDQSPFILDFKQNNLRGRVAAMAYYQDSDSGYQHAVHYDYDIHGNVQTLSRENVILHDLGQGFKEVSYDYDLVSGNVNKVYYQRGKDDEFTHRYVYDDDNRLTDVFTSSDGIHWDRDAEYFYYLHGPLKRVQLGELLVQGMDYAYTIHGWLKAVNGNNLIVDNEIGLDGSTASTSSPNKNANVARDVFGFSLHYYNGDYESINGHTDPTGSYTGQSFLLKDAGSSFAGSIKQLYNGNISRMVTALDKLGSDAIVGRSYEYDQLNRISKAHTYNNIADNSWLSTGSSSSFTSEYTYDANGNILSLKRNAGGGVAMDDLSYHYKTGTNQLTYVDDVVSESAFSNDIDDQAIGNYTYDKIGNLISDVAEEIEKIEWTVYGKIKSIKRISASAKPDLNFEYSPDGHRVAKHVLDTNGQTTSTWYTRDASGNIMATYKREWVDPATSNSVTIMDIFDQLVLDQSYESRLQLLDQQLDWINSVPAANLNTVQNSISNAQASSVLVHFSLQNYLGSTETTAIYDGLIPDGVLAVLHNNGINDPQIYDMLCNTSFTELLIAQIAYDFHSFLFQLHQFHPTAFNDILVNLKINTAQPIPFQIMDIMSSSDPIYIANFLAKGAGSADCPIYQMIYDMVIGVNHPGSWDVLKSVNGFKTTMWSQYTWQTWLSFFETGLGNKNTWDQLFIAMPNTQSSWLSDVKTNEAQAFLFYAMLELENEVLLRSTVSSMTGKTIEDWLDAIEAQYGVEYTNTLKSTLGYGTSDPYWVYKLAENHIYGSSRLGLSERNLPLVQQVIGTEEVEYLSYTNDSVKTFYRGQKRYELSNHLGNVLAVITDRRIQACNVAGVMYYNAQVVSVSDYYPFGMGIKEREWKDSTFSYRFGFNGQEQDNEVSGEGNTIAFEARIYDSRLGRFFSTDPWQKKYAWQTPYTYFKNSPISTIDFMGKGGKEDPPVIGPIANGGSLKEVIVKAKKNVVYGPHPAPSESNTSSITGNYSNPFEKTPEDYVPAESSETFKKAEQFSKQIFDYSLDLEGTLVGGKLKGQVGPIKLEGSVSLLKLKGELGTQDNFFEGNISALNASGGAGFANAEAKGSYSAIKGDVDIPYDITDFQKGTFKTNVTSGSIGYDGGQFEMTANNSARLGAGVKIGPVKASAGINFYYLGKYVEATLIGTGEYIIEQINPF